MRRCECVLRALEAGATHVDTAVLGIGERVGGLLACLMVVDGEYVVGKYKIEKLGDVERIVARAVEVEMSFDKWDVSDFAEARLSSGSMSFEVEG